MRHKRSQYWIVFLRAVYASSSMSLEQAKQLFPAFKTRFPEYVPTEVQAISWLALQAHAAEARVAAPPA